MTEPTCRACWLATLPDAERERVAAEAITSCIHLCAAHQGVMDRLLRDLPPIPYIKATALRAERDFFRAIDMDDAADHCEQSAIGHDADVRLPQANGDCE